MNIVMGVATQPHVCMAYYYICASIHGYARTSKHPVLMYEHPVLIHGMSLCVTLTLGMPIVPLHVYDIRMTNGTVTA